MLFEKYEKRFNELCKYWNNRKVGDVIPPDLRINKKCLRNLYIGFIKDFGKIKHTKYGDIYVYEIVTRNTVNQCNLLLGSQM